MSSIRGQSISESPIVSHPNAYINLPGFFREKKASFGISLDDLSKHTILIGSTGCGKTTLLFQYVQQILNRMSDKDIIIIFDSKGDYFNKFYNSHEDLVIGNSKKYRDKSVHWNMFKEIVDGLSKDDWEQIKQNASEICRSLFQDKVKNSNNHFFPNAARELLETVLLLLLKNALEDQSIHLNNHYLYNFFKEHDMDGLREFISLEDEYLSVLSYIGEEAEGQALGVYSEMNVAINELLTGVFCKENKGFSIRNFVRKKDKRILFIEYDIGLGNTLTPVYRLLLDFALKEAMSSNSDHKNNVYLICDEFRLLPELKHMDDAVNFGRSLGVKVIAGIQSVEQIYDAYGKNHGNAILAGFSNMFLFRSNDWATRQYISDLLGRTITMDLYKDYNNEYKPHIREGHVAEDWDLMNLKIGQAIVCLPFEQPFLFQFTDKGV